MAFVVDTSFRASYHLTRETSFYQEAWLASESYLVKIGEDLVENHGFRKVETADKLLLGLPEDDAEEHLVSIIASSSHDNPTSPVQDAMTIHLLQLPRGLHSLIAAFTTYDSPIPTPTSEGIQYLTCISPSSRLVLTEHSLSIGPLRDLVHFLQCLLPPSAALALTPIPYHSSNAVPNPKSGNYTIQAKNHEVATPVVDADQCHEEKRECAPPKHNMHKVRFSLPSLPEGKEPQPISQNDETAVGLPIKQTQTVIIIAPSHSDQPGTPPPTITRAPTPKPDARWLDKNEALLRDIVGCSHFRQLREIAV